MIELEKIIEKIKTENYNFFGIRKLTDSENYAVGDECGDSYLDSVKKNTYGTEYEQSLSETSALWLKIDPFWDSDEEIYDEIRRGMSEIESCGETAVLIAGYRADEGDCEGEIIIRDAVVLAKL